jgi:ABC-type sugar transport system permease subunit
MITVMIVVLMVLFMTLTAAFIAAFFPALLAMLFAALVPLMPLMLPGTDVPRLVFLRPYEIHLPVARMILAAMQAPGPGVLGRNVQIQRFGHDHMRRRLLNDDRPGIEQRWRRPAIEVYTTIYTRRNLSLNGH